MFLNGIWLGDATQIDKCLEYLLNDFSCTVLVMGLLSFFLHAFSVCQWSVQCARLSPELMFILSPSLHSWCLGSKNVYFIVQMENGLDAEFQCFKLMHAVLHRALCKMWNVSHFGTVSSPWDNNHTHMKMIRNRTKDERYLNAAFAIFESYIVKYVECMATWPFFSSFEWKNKEKSTNNIEIHQIAHSTA